MDLKNQLLKENSKINTLKILEWIGDDKRKIDQLVILLLSKEYCVVQRSSWVVSSLAEAYPRLMEKYLPEIINRMIDNSVHIGVRRNLIRSLQFMNIPQSLQGLVLEACFSFLENPKEGNVVQVFSMTVVERLTEEYPEIILEFKSIIERNLENAPSPAFRNRANKILLRLNKR